MTEKEKLIARLNELGAQLDRKVNTSGTIQELSMRIAELEEELNDGTDTDSVENGGVSDGSASTGAVEPVPPVDTVLSGRTDDALMAVEALATLHIEALHATRDELVSIVEAGTVIRVKEADADSLVALGLVREH
ncbi:DNA-packaging protein [Salmonella enterica subsp. enterica]|uniref:DNA-packaging protein n=3 Tax=Enterobacteriaceae TaxID=543 RepID=A0A5W2JCJ0_SALET|nr:DNA-packaging protein [Salmonella enterica subsp. enterica serovar Bareilly]EBS6926803.1 DNA-packaging protein [Salmonella enterica]ECD4125834.1 DNA-packaging protein [Salmonella enterica subsp. enterica serovar Galiema]ECI4110728.1 DNA-packaging protein [Salmonella enterica subsp. enterica]EHK2055049.1 DNA-packaging protein [Salmonella enterica subsp. enterica serovar Richmond]HCZ4678686.1 DNA-packaging protein [Salmonella enterica subsp. enterica serovar Saintpaul str. CFSAN004163]